MQEIIIERDGQKDLKFKGKKLASASGRWVAGQEQTRWTEIAVYETESGRYVVTRNHYTLWQGEENSYGAEICETQEQVMTELMGDDLDGGYILSDLAKEVLNELAQEDEAFKAFQYEEV